MQQKINERFICLTTSRIRYCETGMYLSVTYFIAGPLYRLHPYARQIHAQTPLRRFVVVDCCSSCRTNLQQTELVEFEPYSQIPVGNSELVHCKNIRMTTVILWRVFHILMEPVTSVHVCIRIDRRPGAHVAMLARASLFRRNRGYAKIWKTRHKISVDIRIFLTVHSEKYCSNWPQTRKER